MPKIAFTVLESSTDAGAPLDITQAYEVTDLIRYDVPATGGPFVTGAPQSKVFAPGDSVLLSPLAPIAANTLTDPLSIADVLLMKEVSSSTDQAAGITAVRRIVIDEEVANNTDIPLGATLQELYDQGWREFRFYGNYSRSGAESIVSHECGTHAVRLEHLIGVTTQAEAYDIIWIHRSSTDGSLFRVLRGNNGDNITRDTDTFRHDSAGMDGVGGNNRIALRIELWKDVQVAAEQLPIAIKRTYAGTTGNNDFNASPKFTVPKTAGYLAEWHIKVRCTQTRAAYNCEIRTAQSGGGTQVGSVFLSAEGVTANNANQSISGAHVVDLEAGTDYYMHGDRNSGGMTNNQVWVLMLTEIEQR